MTVQVRMDVDAAFYDRIYNSLERHIEDTFPQTTIGAILDEFHALVRRIYIEEKYGEWVSDNFYGAIVGQMPIKWLNYLEFEITMDASDATLFKLTWGGK